ncbi:hypothetical protein RIR_jg387.t1 [Rhizophagus irregularis DAOM 181602=DAOM 197198]|nr:hypothetical protein RIR_jg387.t1 [Rhizophagus irregularis DAOM 181602=DAOM 197198]
MNSGLLYRRNTAFWTPFGQNFKVLVLRRFLKRIKGCRAFLDEPDLEYSRLSGRFLDGIRRFQVYIWLKVLRTVNCNSEELRRLQFSIMKNFKVFKNFKDPGLLDYKF